LRALSLHFVAGDGDFGGVISDLRFKGSHYVSVIPHAQARSERKRPSDAA